MRGLLFFILIAGLAFGVYWFVTEKKKDGRIGVDISANAPGLNETAEKWKDNISEKLQQFSLKSDDIQKELAESGRVVRKKSEQLGKAVSEATSDTRITAAIKAKLVAEPDLSALSISVNTTDGLVTLSGSASGPEHISKAMLIALETDGVREVVSTIQTRQTAGSTAR